LYLPDVRNICVDIRKDILSFCNLTFSGVVPNGMKPEDHRAIKTARSMGAQIHDKINRFLFGYFSRFLRTFRTQIMFFLVEIFYKNHVLDNYFF